MNRILSLFNKHIKSKPMLFIGLKFLFWFVICKNAIQLILNAFPNVLNEYLFIVSQTSVSILNSGLGLAYEMYPLKSGVGIWSNEYLSVVINETCGGIPIYTLFLTLVIAFVPKISRVVWGSLLGIVLLLIANNIRIIGIILVKEFSPLYFKFAHEILFVYLMYGLMLWIWYKLFSLKKSNT
ncbi:MAG: hypothetical protein ACPG6V_04585 [Flavobacteriales bacterium]